MNTLKANDVTLEQLEMLAQITAAVSKAAKDAQKKLKDAGQSYTETSNWKSSGHRGAELLLRFASGVLGSIEVAEALRIFEQLDTIQKSRESAVDQQITEAKKRQPKRKK